MADPVPPNPAGDPPNPAPAGDPPPAPDPKLTLEEYQAKLEESQKALKAANRESAERRKQLDALAKAEEDRKTAEMTELQKLQQKTEQLEKEKKASEDRLIQTLIRSAIVEKASALNFVDPSDAVALLDKSKLTVDDEGKVDGLDDALKELLKAKPHLVKRAPGLGPTNPGQNGSSGETDAQRRHRLGLA